MRRREPRMRLPSPVLRTPDAVTGRSRYRTVTVRSPGVRNIASDAQARNV